MNRCNCSQARATWHPTRLLDVSPNLSIPENFGREILHLKLRMGPNPRFWKLQTSNYNELKGGISISNLPRTIQHAIELTRALNIRFILIDALCIIQDSVGQQDWLRESTTMADVYGHSHINIAATSSADAEGGLFRERDPVLVNGICIKPHGNDGEG
jgi:hypothetical protein